jgi:uncharacterized membrane protein (TIGR02234 family)
MVHTRRPLIFTMVAQGVGAAAALLISGRTWQTVRAVRPRPLTDQVLEASGRTLQPAIPALALAALAGVVAVLATHGLARRVVGGLVALIGIALAWQAIIGFTVVSPSRALSLQHDAHPGAGLGATQTVHVQLHAEWPALTVLAALFMVAAGAAVAWRGHRFPALSRRYEAPAPAGRHTREQTDAALWTTLDRGEDPTAQTES